MLNTILTKTSQITRTNSHYIFHNGKWIFLAQGFSILNSFLATIILSRILSVSDFGTYRYLVNAFSIAGSLGLSGIGTALTTAAAANNDGILNKSLNKSIFWNFIISFGIFIWALITLTISKNPTIAFGLIAVTIFAPFVYSYGIYSQYLIGKKIFNKNAIYEIVSDTGIFIMISITAVISKNPLYVFVIFLITQVFFSVLFYKQTKSQYVKNELLDKKYMDFGTKSSISGIFSSFVSRLDSVIIFGILGPTSLAIYSIATIFPEQMKNIFRFVPMLLLPQISERGIAHVKRKTFLFTLIVVVGIILYILLAPFLIKIFFPEYLESVFYSIVLSISTIAVISYIPMTILQSQHDYKKINFLNIATSIIGLTTLFIGSFLLGIWGIIISRIVTRISTLFMSYYLIKKTT